MIRSVGELVRDASAKVDKAFVSKTRHQLAGFGVERQQFAVHGAGQNLCRVLGIACPVSHATQRRAYPAQTVGPNFFTGFRFQRDNGPLRRWSEEYASHHHRHCFHALPDAGLAAVGIGGRRCDPVLPCQLQFGNIFGVDLSESGVPLSACTAIVGSPFTLGPLRRKQHRQYNNQQPDAIHSHA